MCVVCRRRPEVLLLGVCGVSIDRFRRTGEREVLCDCHVVYPVSVGSALRLGEMKGVPVAEVVGRSGANHAEQVALD